MSLDATKPIVSSSDCLVSVSMPTIISLAISMPASVTTRSTRA
jgi:hypothetical protein